MAEPAADNSVAKPVAAPVADVQREISSDIRQAATKALAEQRPAPQEKPAEAAKPEPTGGEVKEFPRLMQPEPPKKETPAGIDPAKLSPELQELYKSMQADYTRKTQELSEMRKQQLDEREKWLEKISQRLETPRTPEATPPVNPLEQIRQLRDEGRHDEADKLLIEATERAAMERVAGLERNAKIAELKSTFRDTVTDTGMNDKIVGAFRNEVAQVFDGDHPVLREVRAEALKSPERIKTWVPAIMHMLAVEQYALRLEKEVDARVADGIKKGIEAEKAAASKVPSRLVESGGESKTPSGQQFSSVRDAAKAALAQLTGG